MENNQPPKLATNTYLDLAAEGIISVVRGHELARATSEGAWRIVGMYSETRVTDMNMCRYCNRDDQGDYNGHHHRPTNKPTGPEPEKFLVSEQFFVLAKGTDKVLGELREKLNQATSDRSLAKQEASAKGTDLEQALKDLARQRTRAETYEASTKTEFERGRDMLERYRKMEVDMGKIRKEVGDGRVRQILCIAKDEG